MFASQRQLLTSHRDLLNALIAFALNHCGAGVPIRLFSGSKEGGAVP